MRSLETKLLNTGSGSPTGGFKRAAIAPLVYISAVARVEFVLANLAKIDPSSVASSSAIIKFPNLSLTVSIIGCSISSVSDLSSA